MYAIFLKYKANGLFPKNNSRKKDKKKDRFITTMRLSTKLEKYYFSSTAQSTVKLNTNIFLIV